MTVHFGPGTEFGRLVRPADLHDILKINFFGADTLKQSQNRPAHQGRTREHLAHSHGPPLHPGRQIDLPLAGEQLYRPHFPEVNPHGVVDVSRLLRLGSTLFVRVMVAKSGGLVM